MIAENNVIIDQICLSSIISNIPHFIFWKDANLVYLGCNENFAIASGLKSPSEIIGKTDYDLPWRKFGADIYRKEDKEVLSGKIILNKEVPLETANGENIIISVSKTPLRDSQNKIIGVLGIYSDITEQKKYEEGLIKAKALAEAANKAKTEFLSSMSHDLRTPFSGIYGLSKYLYSVEKNKDKKESLFHIVESGERLMTLINQIIELISIEDTANDQVETFNLHDLVNDIVKLMSAKIKIKGLTFTTQYPKIKIKTIKLSIYRIILNLLGNAIKFTNKGNIKLIIKKTKKDLEIIVQDTGIGIAAENIDLIFDKFMKVEPSYKQQEFSGSGIGLYLVKQLTEQLNGHIKVESQLEKGSKFIVSFPLEGLS